MADKDSDRIYLDYAAATPTHSDVVAAMAPYWQENFANPQATHTEGHRSQVAVEKARQEIAATLGVQSTEIIFTSGATEANSLALLGGQQAFRSRVGEPGEVIVSEIAHPSVYNLNRSQDTPMVEAPVGESGRLVVEKLAAKITKQTSLVSIEYINSEIGVVQPVAAVAKAVKAFRTEAGGEYPLLHVDASQAGLYESLAPHKLGVDLMTINAQKLHGPKGVGVLWVRSGTPLASLFVTGSPTKVGDYQSLRPGTPPTPLIVGMAKALAWADKHRPEHKRQVAALQTYFFKELRQQFPECRTNGSLVHRTANNVSVTFPEVDHDYLASRLDARGVAAATTSACQTHTSAGSRVVGKLVEDGNQAIRFSLGITTTKAEIDRVITILEDLL